MSDYFHTCLVCEQEWESDDASPTCPRCEASSEWIESEEDENIEDERLREIRDDMIRANREEEEEGNEN